MRDKRVMLIFLRSAISFTFKRIMLFPLYINKLDRTIVRFSPYLTQVPCNGSNRGILYRGSCVTSYIGAANSLLSPISWCEACVGAGARAGTKGWACGEELKVEKDEVWWACVKNRRCYNYVRFMG